MNEQSLITKVIWAVVIGALVLLLTAFVWLQTQFPPPADPALKVKYLEQYVAVLQILAVGVVAAVVTVIIPLLLPEARDRFERYKESRQAYSKAKTAVMYLPDRVASAADMKEAVKLVQEAHRQLHFAETFERELIDKGYLSWFANPKLWILYNYWQIVAIKMVLHRAEWGDIKSRELLRGRLAEAVQVVHDFFGERGEKVEGERWVIKDVSLYTNEKPRFKKEKELKTKVDQKVESLMRTSGVGTRKR